jgi:hypothetical protein
VTVVVDEVLALEARSLVRLLDGTLSRVQAVYATAGVELPSRRYWTLGMPAWDCEQLVVSFVQAYFGPPGDEAARPQSCDGPRSAALTVNVVRCIPTGSARGKPPTPKAIEDMSEQLAIDAYLLLDLARELDQWDPGYPGMGVIATVDASEAQGGFQGVTLHVTTAIP